MGWSSFVSLPVEEVGSLRVLFAPLAFLWLVIGYFLQQQELIQNTQAMRAQADEIAKQFDLFYKTEIRARHTNQFIFVFERLMKHVRHSDTDNMLFDSLSGNAQGLLLCSDERASGQRP